LFAGDGDPTPELRDASAGTAGHSTEHLVCNAGKGDSLKTQAGHWQGLGPFKPRRLVTDQSCHKLVFRVLFWTFGYWASKVEPTGPLSAQ
jgi:hypothetical protein